MVYAFFIQTVPPLPQRILYSVVFGCPTEDNELADDIIKREKRKRELSVIALRVQSECSFMRSDKPKSDQTDAYLADVVAPQPEAETGLFYVAADPNHPVQPSNTELVVIWRSQMQFAFTLVIYKTENRLLAQEILRLLSHYLQEYVHILLQPRNILLKPDKIQAVVDKVMPNGQLLFMTQTVVKQLDKEIQKAVK